MNIQLKSVNDKPCLSMNSKNFILTDGFTLNLALEELRLLDTGFEIKFENFRQFNELINKIMHRNKNLT